MKELKEAASVHKHAALLKVYESEIFLVRNHIPSYHNSPNRLSMNNSVHKEKTKISYEAKDV